jgi:hypothetical protein
MEMTREEREQFLKKAEEMAEASRDFEFEFFVCDQCCANEEGYRINAKEAKARDGRKAVRAEKQVVDTINSKIHSNELRLLAESKDTILQLTKMVRELQETEFIGNEGSERIQDVLIDD